MSRSIVRFFAAVVVAAAVPVVAQAQVSCTIQPGSASPQTCGVTGSVTVPTLARLSVSGDSLSGSTLTLTSPVWATYLSTPVATSTLSQATMLVRSNTSYDVQIRSAASWTVPAGGSRALADLKYTAAVSCPAVGSITTAMTATDAPLFDEGSAATGTTRLLCLRLDWSGDIAGGDLVPGTYSLPITLTLTAP